jgi:hypothetical protein
MSNAAAGVIGAMVTLAVVLGVELLVIFFGGLTLGRRVLVKQPSAKTPNIVVWRAV